MTTCPICLSVILQGKECRTDCNHIYCYNCLHRWFDKKKNTCPYCRRAINYFTYNNENTKIIFIDNSNNINMNPLQNNTQNDNTNMITVSANTYNILKFTSILGGLFLSLNIYLLVESSI